MPPADTVDALRTKITNYRRTRLTSAKSMHHWLDALIADAEQELHRRTHRDPESPPAPTFRPPDVRNTYPFDENAPRQRIA